MSEPRIIKKYPNRRLYDTEISSYVTLEDVRQLVLDEVSFCVRDAKSNADITRTILMQIIMEREEDGEPIFNERMLGQIIRFYGDSLQGVMAKYLEKSLTLFTDQHASVQEQMRKVMAGDPLALMREATEQNLAMWKDMQEGFLRAAAPASGTAPRKKKSKRSSSRDAE